MKHILQVLGQLAYFFAWPAYWFYFKRGMGRTRVVVQNGDDILVVKQWMGDGRWQLPGGGLLRREDPAVGAARELHEETGISVKPKVLKLLGQATQTSRGLKFNFYAFSTSVASREIKMQKIEICEVVWLPPSSLSIRNTVPDAITAIAMLK